MNLLVKQCLLAFTCNDVLPLLQVLEELDVGHIPMVSVWNKVDVCTDPDMVQTVANKREETVCISAQTGQGLPELLQLIESKIQEGMLPVDVVVPYAQVHPPVICISGKSS